MQVHQCLQHLCLLPKKLHYVLVLEFLGLSFLYFFLLQAVHNIHPPGPVLTVGSSTGLQAFLDHVIPSHLLSLPYPAQVFCGREGGDLEGRSCSS